MRKISSLFFESVRVAAAAIPLAFVTSNLYAANAVRQQSKVPGERDVTLNWSTLDTPSAEAKRGWFLEFACGDIITNFSVDGKEIELIPSKNLLWSGAERGAILPVGESHKIEIKKENNTILYPNGIGRVTLSPATVDQAIAVKREKQPGMVTLENKCPIALEGETTALFTDFFGVELSRATLPFKLAPGEKKRLAFTPPANYWKAEYRVTTGGETSHPYWAYQNPKQWFTSRDEKIYFTEKFPVEFDPEKEKSHTRKFSFTARIPSSWKGKRIFLGVPTVHYKAEFTINGAKAGETFLWETPAKLDITDHVKAGEELKVDAVVTDASAAASKNWTSPSPGSQPHGFRPLGAAVGHYPRGKMSGFRSRLVLLAENDIATEDVVIVPELRDGGKFLKVGAKIRGTADAQFAIYDKGHLVKKLAADSRVWRVDELQFWTPENPKLYELRVTLEKDGKTLDVSRWRFGFRTTDINGKYFTLNGKPFYYLGFSQLYMQRMVWPALPPPSNFARWNFHDDTHGMGGAAMAHIADELGVLIKGENLAHNAHAGERYDYEDETTWQRLESEMKHIIRAFRNSPSIAFWDIGNETSFSKSGEPERCGKLMADIRRFDPTRHVTVSGAVHLPKGDGVRIVDYHGRVSFGGDADMIARSEKPIMFSESMYMHARLIPGMVGEDLFFANRLGLKYGKLPKILGRRYMIRQCRRSGVAASLGHVANFHGREISPISAATADESLRFFSGDEIKIALDVYNRVSHKSQLDISLSLCTADKVLAVRKKSVEMNEQDRVRLDFEFGKFNFENDERLMLFIDVDADNSAAYRDLEEVAVYRRIEPVVSQGVRLSVCDPSGIVVKWLREKKIAFTEISSPRDWKGGKGETLYLFNCDDANAAFPELPALTDSDSHGLSPCSELGAEFTKNDLRYWRGANGDFRIARRLMQLPDRGNFRVLAAGSDTDKVRVETSALADFAVKSGTVRVSRMNFTNNLGREPAAERLLAYLVSNPPRAFDVPRTAVWCGGRMRKALASRSGVYEFLEMENLPDLKSVDRLVVDGKGYARLLKESGGELSDLLERGGRLLVLDAPRGDKFALGRARVTRTDELLSGLSSGDFFWFDGKGGTNRSIKSYDESKGKDDKSIATHLVEMNSGDIPLISPAYIVKRISGKGVIYFTTLDLIRSPSVEAGRVLATILTNFGVPLDCDKANERILSESLSSDWECETVEQPAKKWTFAQPTEIVKIAFTTSDAAKVRIWYEDRDTWIPGAANPFDDFSIADSGTYEWRNLAREKKVVEVEVLSGEVLKCVAWKRKAPAALEKLLPKFKKEDVLCRHEWGDFGIVVSKDGSVPLVYRREDGQPLLELNRYFVQLRKDVDGKPRHRLLENAPKTAVYSMRDDVLCVTNVGKWVDAAWEYRFKASGFDLNISVRAKQSPGEGERINLFYSGSCPGAEWAEKTVNVNPLIVAWPEADMTMSLGYTPSLRWHGGYWTGKKTSFTFTPLHTRTKSFKAGEEGSVHINFDFR